MPKTIDLFMWGYQEHFRISLEVRAKRMFDLLGADVEPTALLVGLRRPDAGPGHPACVEPEKGEWPIALFEELEASVVHALPNHPAQTIFYGDEPSNREKPALMRLDTVSKEVLKRLADDDRRRGRRSFSSQAHPVGAYDVVCVLQVPERLFTEFPSIELEWQCEPYETSLALVCIRRLLEDARQGLAAPEPGRLAAEERHRTAEEIIRLAASSFMRSPFLAGRHCFSDLFADVNRLSDSRYEGQSGTGTIVLARADDPHVEHLIKLEQPVALSNTRWARKLLQMATGDAALLAEYGTITSVGRVSPLSAGPYEIDLHGDRRWDLRRGNQVLLRCSAGEARLPQEPIGKVRFADNIRRLFPGVGEPAIDRFHKVLDILSRLDAGSSTVIAEDAPAEAARLARQGTVIAPTRLTAEFLACATAIDGSLLVDPDGVCHAIGVILDGQAGDESTPSRGARYNSAVRYVGAGTAPRMAIVISEDRTVDVVPLLRPKVDRRRLEAEVAAITTATLDDYHKPRSFLDAHRFYLDAAQCATVNEALDRIESEPREMGLIVIVTGRFKPHPAMDNSYLSDDGRSAW